jgi:hypothetical protein
VDVSVSVPVVVATTVVVVLVEAVAKAGIVTVAVAAGEVMRQLQAELIRVAGTVARIVERFAGVVASRASISRFFSGLEPQAAWKIDLSDLI